MSKEYAFNTGPFTDLKSTGPGTVEEYDAKAGAGVCLEDGVRNVILRSHVNEFWDTLAPKLEKLLGVPMQVDVDLTAKAVARAKPGAKVSDVYESAIVYAKRELAKATPEQKAEANRIAKETASSLYIDVSPGRRSSGPSAKDYAKADDILGRDAAGYQKGIATLSSVVPDFQVETDDNGKATRESLAAWVKEFMANV